MSLFGKLQDRCCNTRAYCDCFRKRRCFSKTEYLASYEFDHVLIFFSFFGINLVLKSSFFHPFLNLHPFLSSVHHLSFLTAYVSPTGLSFQTSYLWMSSSRSLTPRTQQTTFCMRCWYTVGTTMAATTSSISTPKETAKWVLVTTIFSNIFHEMLCLSLIWKLEVLLCFRITS